MQRAAAAHPAGWLALLVLALAGCGGAGSNPDYYAGLEQYEAAAAARKAISHEASDPASPVHGQALLFAEMEPSTLDEVGEAWLIRYERPDGTPSERCIWIWSGPKAAFQSNYVYEAGRCPARDAQ